jgi:choline dehydrogenase
MQMCSVPAGKGLGGSSVNGMIYMRGSPKDYDEWGRITGDSIWSSESVLKTFKKSEDYHGYFQPPSERQA